VHHTAVTFRSGLWALARGTSQRSSCHMTSTLLWGGRAFSACWYAWSLSGVSRWTGANRPFRWPVAHAQPAAAGPARYAARISAAAPSRLASSSPPTAAAGSITESILMSLSPYWGDASAAARTVRAARARGAARPLLTAAYAAAAASSGAEGP